MKKGEYYTVKIILCVFLFSLLMIGKSFGQVSNIISSVRIGDAKEKMPLSISAELFTAENISIVSLVYRSFGQTEFKKTEMLIAGNTASVTIPADEVQPPYLEYYLSITLRNGTTQTYPLDIDKGVAPLQIPVSAYSQKDKEIFILSPSAGEILSVDELLISISFIKAPDNIDVNKTKIYLNGQDITSSALITGDLIILNGENLSGTVVLGAKLLKIDVYDKSGNLYHSISRSFQTVSAEVAMLKNTGVTLRNT